MSEPHVAAELEPRFLVTVTLDGDDDPHEQTKNVLYWIEGDLARMQHAGLIRDYTIERAP